MSCKKCEKELKAGEKFCLNCGNSTDVILGCIPVEDIQLIDTVDNTDKSHKNNKKPVPKKKKIAISLLSVLMVVALAVSCFFIYNSFATSKFRKAVNNKDINEMMSLYYFTSDSKQKKYNIIVSDKIQEISQDLNSHSFDNECDENGNAVMKYLTSKWGGLVPETLSDEAWEGDGLAAFIWENNDSGFTAKDYTNEGNNDATGEVRSGTREFNYSVWYKLYDLAKSKTNYCKAMYYYNSKENYYDAIRCFSLVSVEDSTYNTSLDKSKDCVNAIFDEILAEVNADFESGAVEDALNKLEKAQKQLSQYGDTQEHITAINSAISSYAESYIKKAEDYLKSGDIEAAVGHVEAAMTINPNGNYESKLEEYKKYLPLKMYLSENVLASDGLYKEDSLLSVDGKQYDNCIVYSWWTGASPKSANYYLGGNYDTVSGVFFTTAESAKYQFDGYAYIEAYGDGKLIYTSSSMKWDSVPANIEFSVTGVQKLEVRFVGKDSTAAYIYCPEVALSELTAHKNPPQ